MSRARIARGVLAATVAAATVCAVACGLRDHPRRSRTSATTAGSAPPATTPAPPPAADAGTVTAPGFLYGRVTTVAGEVYTGRLRFGGDQEAFWDETFNGFKPDNPWAKSVPAGRLPMESR